MQVHSRELESILLLSRVECIDGVPQVVVPRAIPAHQCLPSSVGHYLSTHRSRSGTSVHADHLLSIEDLHYAAELHVSRSWNALDLVLWGIGDGQLK
jgi:hypothetical protein